MYNKLASLAPTHLPPLSLLVDDLHGNRSPESIGRHLGVSGQTVRRWIKTDQAPRAAMLALFYETRWGRSAVNTRAENDARMFAGLARCYERLNNTLQARVSRLEAIGDFAAANSPVFTPSVQLSLSLAP